eukprot:9914752-Heterocapsa_arctica.AAC.1
MDHNQCKTTPPPTAMAAPAMAATPGLLLPPTPVGLPDTGECVANMGSAFSGQSVRLHLPAPPR